MTQCDDDDDNDNDNNNESETNNDDNNTQQTNHDCIGSLAYMPNEPTTNSRVAIIASICSFNGSKKSKSGSIIFA